MPEHIQQIYYGLPKTTSKTPGTPTDLHLKRKGTQSVKEGGMYAGFWNKETNKREGLGTVVWNDGSMYEGFWNNDQPHGHGRMVKP